MPLSFGLSELGFTWIWLHLNLTCDWARDMPTKCHKDLLTWTIIISTYDVTIISSNPGTVLLSFCCDGLKQIYTEQMLWYHTKIHIGCTLKSQAKSPEIMFWTLWPRPLTYDFVHQIWPRYGPGTPPCKMSVSQTVKQWESSQTATYTDTQMQLIIFPQPLTQVKMWKDI